MIQLNNPYLVSIIDSQKLDICEQGEPPIKVFFNDEYGKRTKLFTYELYIAMEYAQFGSLDDFAKE